MYVHVDSVLKIRQKQINPSTAIMAKHSENKYYYMLL